MSNTPLPTADGIEVARQNLGDDLAQFASYVYDRMSAYVGPDHKGHCCALLMHAIQADRSMGARIAELEAALKRVHEDHLYAHYAIERTIKSLNDKPAVAGGIRGV